MGHASGAHAFPRPRRAVGIFLFVLAFGGSGGQALANPESDQLRLRGFRTAYNLDHDEAMALLRRAVEVDPQDPATHRSVAAVTWLNILFSRGAVTVDEYLGGLSRAQVALKEPPSELADEFRRNAERALALAEEQLSKDASNAAAQYELGAAVGLLAAYSASVEGKLLAGFRAARRAFDAHERVLELDPSRKDAGLIVGTYRYVVGSMSLPLRLMAYVVGFGGGRELGMDMVREAAEYPSDAQTEAKFALLLIYNREKRFDDALAVVASLQKAYPKNRLLWLEAGATALRAGRPRDAVSSLSEGMRMLAADSRPRAFGEEAMWRYKRGAALVALKDAGARKDLQEALGYPSRAWIQGRVHLELGKLADLAGDRSGAQGHYRQAIELCRTDKDPAGADEASRFAKTPYRP